MTPLRLLLACALTGCLGTTITEVPINLPPHAMSSRPSGSVEVFSAARPDRPFVDVAYLEAEVRGDDTSAVLAKLRARAAELGCDAIVFQGASERDKGNSQHGYAATCIVYSDGT